MGRRGGWLSIALLFLLIAGETAARAEDRPCSENVGYGPLVVQGHSFFQLLHLNPTPSAPSTLPPRGWEGRFTATWVNDWAVVKDRYFVDSETVQGTAKVAHALTERFQLGIEISFFWRSGGILDRPIEGFHRAFGLGNLDRKKYPRDRMLVRFYREDGSVFVLNRQGLDLEDAVLSSQYTLTCGGRLLPAAALNVSASLPTGHHSSLSGTGGVDLGIALLLAKRFGKVYFYLNGGLVRLGNRDFVGIPLRSHKWTLFSGVEYRVLSRTSLILQNTSNSGLARSDEELSTFSDEMTLGVEQRLSSRLVFEFAFVENLFHFKNSADFGIHGGIACRF